jgi:transcriptional regulator with XRE-family HTH domain
MNDNAAKMARQSLGRAIEVQRVHLGMKRKDLAQKASLSYPYISELENGGKEPSAKALRQIADALEMGVAELVALAERYQDADDDRVEQRLDVPTVAAASVLSNSAENVLALSGAAQEPGTSLEPPQPGDDELRVIVRAVVRDEIERLVARELPGIVARELRRVLADTAGTD